jgi:hypothetical protein
MAVLRSSRFESAGSDKVQYSSGGQSYAFATDGKQPAGFSVEWFRLERSIRIPAREPLHSKAKC